MIGSPSQTPNLHNRNLTAIDRSLSFNANNNIFRYMVAVSILAVCFIFAANAVAAADERRSMKLSYDENAVFDPGEVVLHWTAPGDDSLTGRASGYDLRYRPYAAGPIDTDQEWQSAMQALSEPAPALPNQPDSAIVQNLEFGGSYYFCLKAYDNVFNYSGMSNSPFLAAGDTTGYDYVPGDANGDGNVTGLDVVFLVAYFKGIGQPPLPYLAADANGNCIVNAIDETYLVYYFKGWGAPPVRGECIALSGAE